MKTSDPEKINPAELEGVLTRTRIHGIGVE